MGIEPESVAHELLTELTASNHRLGYLICIQAIVFPLTKTIHPKHD